MHCPKRLRIEDQRPVPELVDPDTMFASDGPTGRDARLHDLRARGFDALFECWVGRVERDIGVEIAVAGVKDVADHQSVTLRDSGDRSEERRVGKECEGQWAEEA